MKVLEENGRFMRSKEQNSIVLTPNGMAIDGVEIVHRSLEKGSAQTNFQIHHNVDSEGDVQTRERLLKIARCLAEGRQAEAIFIATMAKWHLNRIKPAGEITKANFNQDEPRDRGEWATEGSSAAPHIEDAQYRGYFHDFMMKNLLQSLASHGAVAIKNIQVFGINGVLAIPDGAALPSGFVKPFFIEMKTGFDAELTANQKKVYPLICAGGHAVSLDPRLRQLGLTPGVPMPPMRVMIAHTYGPGFAMTFHDYCTDFLE